MDPLISNTGDTRFLFGTFDVSAETPVFTGAVVHGSHLTYDPDTNLPTAGSVERIDVQTRSADEIVKTHASFNDVNATVEQLNAAFADAQTPWYDATQVINASATPAEITPQDEDPLLDLDVDVTDPSVAKFLSDPSELCLDTGDVLSAGEVAHIFSAAPTKSAPESGDATSGAENAPVDVISLLDRAVNEPQFYDFNDLDLDALENDLLLGVL